MSNESHGLSWVWNEKQTIQWLWNHTKQWVFLSWEAPSTIVTTYNGSPPKWYLWRRTCQLPYNEHPFGKICLNWLIVSRRVLVSWLMGYRTYVALSGPTTVFLTDGGLLNHCNWSNHCIAWTSSTIVFYTTSRAICSIVRHMLSIPYLGRGVAHRVALFVFVKVRLWAQPLWVSHNASESSRCTPMAARILRQANFPSYQRSSTENSAK